MTQMHDTSGMNRRQWLAGASALATAAMAAPVMAENDEGAKLAALLEALFNERVDHSPYLATSLGLDRGARAGLKAHLDESSEAADAENLARTADAVARLKTIDRDRLDPFDRISLDTILWSRELSLDVARTFPGTHGGTYPYILSQLSGSYSDTPDFLVTQHTIETKDDADAFLSRLDDYALIVTQETERFIADASRGVMAPDFALSKALVQMKALQETLTPDNTMVSYITQRTAEAGIAGDWTRQAVKRVEGPIAAAIAAQIAAVEAKLPSATHDAGVWRLPYGPDFYAAAAHVGTTTKMSPDEIHWTGVELVAQLSALADEALKSLGYTTGSVGERIAALGTDPAFIYANDDETKAQILVDLNEQIKEVQSKLPEWFGILPKSTCEVRRVPKETEAGAPGGYYQRPTLDGSRPGAYYINLRDTAEWPKWSLPTLTYHEAIPGHHLQIALQMEARGLPMLRKISGFSAYSEGWALYAEELAVEMGMYPSPGAGKINPGFVGYLQSAMFRAIRLVVDTGLHHKRWSREQAIAYFVAANGQKESAATTEVERYCVWPGQALSYMTGKLKWMDLRARMRAKQGAAFSIKTFHDTGLQAGAVPLDVLERVYSDNGLI